MVTSMHLPTMARIAFGSLVLLHGLPNSNSPGPAAVPVGRASDAAPAGSQEPHTRVGKRAGTQKLRACGYSPRKCCGWIDGYAAGDSFPVFGCLAGDFAAGFFSAFALSFAANSFLTMAAIASVSTL